MSGGFCRKAVQRSRDDRKRKRNNEALGEEDIKRPRANAAEPAKDISEPALPAMRDCTMAETNGSGATVVMKVYRPCLLLAG